MKKIKPPIDTVLIIMEDQSEFGGSHYIDLETGEIVSPEMEDHINYDDVQDEDRFFYIATMNSHEAYEIMRDFVLEIPSDETRKKMKDVLDRPGPFNNFRDALQQDPELRERFYQFKEDRLTNLLRRRLQEIGYELTL
jgi:hypothetical protein